MAIQPINNAKSKSILFEKKDYVPYLQANEIVETPNNVKPLPGKGYLIHDNIGSSIKYFFKDIPISFNRIGITIYIQVIWYRMRAIIYPAQQRVAYHFFFWRFKSIYNSVIKIVGCPQYSEIVFKNSPHNILCSNQRY